MSRQSVVVFLLILVLLILVGYPAVKLVFTLNPPLFNEGDRVEAKKDISCPWAPPGLNPTLDKVESPQKPIPLHQEKVVVVEQGGDLDSYYFHDGTNWWMRVKIGNVARWCSASNLKLVE